MMELLSTLSASFIALGAVGMGVIAVSVAAILVSSFFEKGTLTFLGVVGLVFGLIEFANANPFEFIVAHPFSIAIGFAAYVGFGVLWSLVKFRFYTGELKNTFSQFKQAHLDTLGAKSLDALDPAELDDFRRRAQQAMHNAARYGSYPVRPQEHKATIMFWMAYWPLSLLAYLLNDPIKQLLDALYRLFSGLFNRIARDQADEYVADMGSQGK